MALTYEEVLAAVRCLPADERRRLQDELAEDSRQRSAQAKQDALDHLLFEKGIILHVPPPITDLAPYRNRKLVRIEGKAVIRNHHRGTTVATQHQRVHPAVAA